MYRLKTIQRQGKTQYILQQRTFWFFWWNLSDPIEDQKIADALLLFFKYRTRFN